MSVYQYDIAVESDTSPARIIRYCGEGKRVLELGAGPGSISRVLVEKMDCDVVCLEIDALCLEQLKTFCNKVYPADLDKRDWYECLESEAPFDHVIIADVLEHLYDPWRVLEEATKFLNSTGSILLSIPHSGHKGIIASLLGNAVDYRDWGLLDRTHIRFFGMKNIQSLIDGAGLAIEEAQFVVRPPDMMELSTEWNALQEIDRNVLNRSKFGDVYQVAARLVPRERASESLILENMKVELPKDAPTPLKLIAFYLPQYHPIPENDEWWGKGFTEWTNVTRATPLFDNHYQPHLPADLGFYDLRIAQTRRDQIDLAKKFGIDGFCYYFYWFSGRRILERPLDEMLADKDSDMPFCLCWANENWTRRWDGQQNEMLLEQKYLHDDDENLIRDMLPYLRDPRYLKFNGRPMIIVYCPQHLPHPAASAERWRQVCQSSGIGDPYLVAAQTFRNRDYAQFGFDASVEFPPHNHTAPNLAKNLNQLVEMRGAAYEYKDVAEQFLDHDYHFDLYSGFRTVVTSWDNTARTGERAHLLLNGTPENYEVWLDRAIRKTSGECDRGDRLVFINAWNEWAEGAHLEPDRMHKHQYLEATLRAKSGQTKAKEFPHHGLDRYAKPTPQQLHSANEGHLRQIEELSVVNNQQVQALSVAHNQQVQELAAEIDHLVRELQEKNELAVRVGTEIRDMYQSLSWRLTAPVRSVLGKFGVK